jgi:DNA-binding response OmpR family regulator
VTASKASILLIEGKRADRPSFFQGLTRKGYHVETAASGNAAIARLADGMPQMVLVDAASMRTSGRRICQSIRKAAPGIPVLVVVEQNADTSEKLDADLVLPQPFTLQKLLNRIRGLLPAEEKDSLQVGQLQLDVEQRWVRIDGKQIRLTPRLVALLKLLMEHPGEVIKRNDLFSQVWDTNYTDDTRTLDVHISWLRQALEEDPRHPHFLKTVRGVGYRLDIDLPGTAGRRPAHSARKPASESE